MDQRNHSKVYKGALSGWRVVWGNQVETQEPSGVSSEFRPAYAIIRGF